MPKGVYVRTEETMNTILNLPQLFKKGQKSIHFKGDKASYRAIHYYVRYHNSKPKVCSFCGKEGSLVLHNKSGKYLRTIVGWEWLCHSCHTKKHKQMKLKIKKYVWSKVDGRNYSAYKLAN